MRTDDWTGLDCIALSNFLNLLLWQLDLKALDQSGALSLVGRVEIVLSLVESFIELKYFHDVATPALLCHKEPARRIQSPLLGALERKIPLLGYASVWHQG